MAQLAIKGHKTRSKEAIQLLEMLGGVNKYRIDAIRETYVYFVDEDRIIRLLQINQLLPEQYIVYSLEEFEEKFPYKVGDKVYNIIHNENQTITEVAWDFQEDVVVYQTNNNEYLFVNYLQPYKEETMEEITIDDFKANTKEWLIDKLESMSKDNALQAICNIHDELHKPQNPKTYIECAKILNCFSASYIDGYKNELLEKLQELLICRDAYWKIAGKQMGLGKSWDPNWTTIEGVPAIFRFRYNIICEYVKNYHCLLAFPTEEMRDAFYENFKDLINDCKELL